MTETKDRALPWNLGVMLAGGFLLVILFGLLGFSQTGRAMQASADRAALMEARVRKSVAQVGAIMLASRDNAAYTQGYLYTAQAEKLERRWEADEATGDGFNMLQATLRALPRSADLRAQSDQAARQNKAVCDPLEERAVALAKVGRRAEAQALFEAQGTPARYRLEIQLDALNTALEAYRIRSVRAEEQSRAHTLAIAWVGQSISLALSLLIAVLVTRAASLGVRAVLRAQADLVQSTARYRLLFERSPHPMWVYNRSTLAFLVVNEAAVRRYGYSRQEFLAMTLLDIRPAEDREAVRLTIGTPQEGRVWRHLTRAGDLLWAEITTHPLAWEVQDAAMVTAQDITARRKAEDALKEAQARLQTVVDNAPLILFSLDAQGIFTASEGKGLALLGLEPGQVVGQSALEVYGGDAVVLPHLRRALDGEAVTYTSEVNGYCWETQCQPLRGEDGTPQGLIGVALDSTERRKAQEGLNQLAAIIHSSRDAVIGWNPDKAVTSWNPGAEQLYGWTEAEMIGRSIETLTPPEREEERLYIGECLLSGQAVEIPDTTHLRRDGTRVEVSISSSLVRDAAGAVIGASTIARNISAQKQAEAEQKKADAMIRWQAYTDPLTSLPNRARFGEELDAAIARSEPFALLFMDLDLFKHVNDSLGHVAGDHLLQQVAGRLAARLAENGSPQDLLARMGGDEFTLLLLPEGGRTAGVDAAVAADDYLDSLTAPIVIEGHELHVAASIGISRFPEDGADAETLLKYADLAMYRAKAEGRGRWQLFTPAMTEAAEDRLRLENSLRKAIERPGGDDGEMMLFYQPQVSLATGEVVGAEALVRWHHPAWGMVLPGRFIPLAEETGLVVPLGNWVLREACRQAAAWAREGRPLRVSVNLSARQLGERGLVPSVQAALDASGLDPHWLDLELTETALIEHLDGKGGGGKDFDSKGGGTMGETAADRLAVLRALGIRLSVDDFGTGYSSLSYLRRLPLDILKVDRSFVLGLTGDLGEGEDGEEKEKEGSGRRDEAVVRAVIDMAHALSLEVIAEGVEHEGQRRTLARLGCDQMQGFLFSPPVSPECLEALLPPARSREWAEDAQWRAAEWERGVAA